MKGVTKCVRAIFAATQVFPEGVNTAQDMARANVTDHRSLSARDCTFSTGLSR